MQPQINFILAERPKLGSSCGLRMWVYRADCEVLQVVDLCLRSKMVLLVCNCISGVV